jgi:hypothetical protein
MSPLCLLLQIQVGTRFTDEEFAALGWPICTQATTATIAP